MLVWALCLCVRAVQRTVWRHGGMGLIRHCGVTLCRHQEPLQAKNRRSQHKFAALRILSFIVAEALAVHVH